MPSISIGGRPVEYELRNLGAATPCHVITSHSTNSRGYVQLWAQGRKTLAHRQLLIERGYDLTGLQAGHACADEAHDRGWCGEQAKCLHRLCVNPDHVVPMTCRENLLASVRTVPSQRARRTHCPKGHPLASGNLRSGPLAEGRRCCLTCDHQRNAETSTLRAVLGVSWREWRSLRPAQRAEARRLHRAGQPVSWVAISGLVAA